MGRRLRGAYDWFVGGGKRGAGNNYAVASGSRESRSQRYQPPPFKRKALFESLEPRLLLSADLLPVPLAPHQDTPPGAAEILTLPELAAENPPPLLASLNADPSVAPVSHGALVFNTNNGVKTTGSGLLFCITHV
ncbi:MAG: LEPR-XLL domain-containing protein [Sedimenticola sp.]